MSQNNEPIIIINSGRGRDALEDSDDDASTHQLHGLGDRPILLASDHSVLQSYPIFEQGSGHAEAPQLKPKKKKWLKRFHFSSLRKFRARLARKAIHRDVYPPIYINDMAANAPGKFPDNTVTTSKYTAWTFVPKVLYEQFRKVTSIYFLLIVILTAIPAISPISPWTSLLGLLFIIVVAGIREGYEDFLRHVADRSVNHREYESIPSTGLPTPVRSENLKVGHLILLHKDQETPADCVLLACSDPKGTAYIQTAQLDGETNLKVLSAPAATTGLTPDTARSLRGALTCEVPHHHLYQFFGTLRLISIDGLYVESFFFV
ncbi:MAG: hypothetical protein Q8P67_15295 [archaeon]|nr:hypothetical protein [archaeon]